MYHSVQNIWYRKDISATFIKTLCGRDNDWYALVNIIIKIIHLMFMP